jgi:hypothetical protein
MQTMTGHAQKGDWHWHQTLAAVASRRLVNPRITLKRPPSVSSLWLEGTLVEKPRRAGVGRGKAGNARPGLQPHHQNGRVGPARAEEPVRRMASSDLLAVCGWQAGGAVGGPSGWGPPVHRRDRGPEGVRSGKLVWIRGLQGKKRLRPFEVLPPFWLRKGGRTLPRCPWVPVQGLCEMGYWWQECAYHISTLTRNGSE